MFDDSLCPFCEVLETGYMFFLHGAIEVTRNRSDSLCVICDPFEVTGSRPELKQL